MDEKDLLCKELLTKETDILATILKELDKTEGDPEKQFEICKKMTTDAMEILDRIDDLYHEKFPDLERDIFCSDNDCRA